MSAAEQPLEGDDSSNHVHVESTTTIQNGIPVESGVDWDLEVLVVGGGFSGVYALHRLRKQGLQVKLFEAGSDFGGVWYWNRYPGARVDSEIPLYQFSDFEIWNTWKWTERFPAHEEIRAYFAHIDKVLDLKKDAYFNTIVNSVHFDGQGWVIGTDTGRVAKCKYLVLATGSSHKKYYPPFRGLKDYQGKLLHSAVWPEIGVDVKGQRVAVIGNGATGIQIVQDLAKEDCHLTAFVRTPSTCLPMNQCNLDPLLQESSKSLWPALFTACKESRTGFAYGGVSGSYYDATEEERTAIFESLWARGGLAFLMSNYQEWPTDKKVNKVVYDFWLSKIRPRVKDPIKREIVAPTKMPYFLGTKRPSLEQDYYESIDRPNVELVDLNATPLREFTAHGIVTSDDKSREFDIIVLATGYDNVIGSLMDMNIKDKNGRTLQEKWKSGIYTHLGLCVNGMPNMFMVYSPQSPAQLSNGPPVIEIQVDWICQALQKMKEEGISAIEAKKDAAEKWRSDVQAIAKMTLLPLTDSWFNGGNIPGKVREQLIYLGGVDKYNKIIRDALDGWQGFETIEIKPMVL